MQEIHRPELEQRATAEMEEQQRSLMAKLQSASAIRRQLEEMEGEGKVNFMSDEEVALLHNFRRFKAGLPKNRRGTFTFRTWADQRDIVPGDEASMIEAPDSSHA